MRGRGEKMGAVDYGPSKTYVCPHCDEKIEVTPQFKGESLSWVGATHGGKDFIEIGECSLCGSTLPLTNGNCCSPECQELNQKVRERISEKMQRRIEERNKENALLVEERTKN